MSVKNDTITIITCLKIILFQIKIRMKARIKQNNRNFVKNCPGIKKIKVLQINIRENHHLLTKRITISLTSASSQTRWLTL